MSHESQFAVSRVQASPSIHAYACVSLDAIHARTLYVRVVQQVKEYKKKQKSKKREDGDMSHGSQFAVHGPCRAGGRSVRLPS